MGGSKVRRLEPKWLQPNVYGKVFCVCLPSWVWAPLQAGAKQVRAWSRRTHKPCAPAAAAQESQGCNAAPSRDMPGETRTKRDERTEPLRYNAFAATSEAAKTLMPLCERNWAVNESLGRGQTWIAIHSL